MPSSYALGAHFESLVKSKLKSGRYGSASEVVREGLRLLEDRDAMIEAHMKGLRDKVRRGVASGKGVPAETVFKRLETKYKKMSSKPRS